MKLIIYLIIITILAAAVFYFLNEKSVVTIDSGENVNINRIFDEYLNDANFAISDSNANYVSPLPSGFYLKKVTWKAVDTIQKPLLFTLPDKEILYKGISVKDSISLDFRFKRYNKRKDYLLKFKSRNKNSPSYNLKVKFNDKILFDKKIDHDNLFNVSLKLGRADPKNTVKIISSAGPLEISEPQLFSVEKIRNTKQKNIIMIDIPGFSKKDISDSLNYSGLYNIRNSSDYYTNIFPGSNEKFLSIKSYLTGIIPVTISPKCSLFNRQNISEIEDRIYNSSLPSILGNNGYNTFSIISNDSKTSIQSDFNQSYLTGTGQEGEFSKLKNVVSLLRSTEREKIFLHTVLDQSKISKNNHDITGKKIIDGFIRRLLGYLDDTKQLENYIIFLTSSYKNFYNTWAVVYEKSGKTNNIRYQLCDFTAYLLKQNKIKVPYYYSNNLIKLKAALPAYYSDKKYNGIYLNKYLLLENKENDMDKYTTLDIEKFRELKVSEKETEKFKNRILKIPYNIFIKEISVNLKDSLNYTDLAISSKYRFTLMEEAENYFKIKKKRNKRYSKTIRLTGNKKYYIVYKNADQVFNYRFKRPVSLCYTKNSIYAGRLKTFVENSDIGLYNWELYQEQYPDYEIKIVNYRLN